LKINGKDVEVQIDFGTLEILYNEKGIDYIAISRRMYIEMQAGELSEAEITKKYNSLEITKSFIYAGAKRYAEAKGKDCPITEEDIKSMSVSEYMSAEMEVSMLIMEFNKVPDEGGTKAKNAKRRS
jgi:hypothetical protein